MIFRFRFGYVAAAIVLIASFNGSVIHPALAVVVAVLCVAEVEGTWS